MTIHCVTWQKVILFFFSYLAVFYSQDISLSRQFCTTWQIVIFFFSYLAVFYMLYISIPQPLSDLSVLYRLVQILDLLFFLDRRTILFGVCPRGASLFMVSIVLICPNQTSSLLITSTTFVLSLLMYANQVSTVSSRTNATSKARLTEKCATIALL